MFVLCPPFLPLKLHNIDVSLKEKKSEVNDLLLSIVASFANDVDDETDFFSAFSY